MMENYGLPDLERLMRSVFAAVLRAEHGERWEADGLSNRARKAVGRNAESVRKSREDAKQQPDWELAGFPQLHTCVSSVMRASEDLMSPVWTNERQAGVDLERVTKYRDRALHGVDPPLSTAEEQELRAIVKRLRFGLEQVRRTIAHERDDYWPYIESISTNIEGWQYRRGGDQPSKARLMAADIIEFRVTAVHPRGAPDEMVYGAGASVDDAISGVTWQDKTTLEMEAPEGRDVTIFVGVQAREAVDSGRHFSDSVYFHALVRPRIEDVGVDEPDWRKRP